MLMEVGSFSVFPEKKSTEICIFSWLSVQGILYSLRYPLYQALVFATTFTTRFSLLLLKNDNKKKQIFDFATSLMKKWSRETSISAYRDQKAMVCRHSLKLCPVQQKDSREFFLPCLTWSGKAAQMRGDVAQQHFIANTREVQWSTAH